MSGHRRRGLAAAVALAGILATGAPALAHSRVFIGGTFGAPAYAWPYGGAYYAPYYAPYYYPAYAYPADDYPPPGWAPGHWEWRRDGFGRRVRVWVPPYLR